MGTPVDDITDQLKQIKIGRKLKVKARRKQVKIHPKKEDSAKQQQLVKQRSLQQGQKRQQNLERLRDLRQKQTNQRIQTELDGAKAKVKKILRSEPNSLGLKKGFRWDTELSSVESIQEFYHLLETFMRECVVKNETIELFKKVQTEIKPLISLETASDPELSLQHDYQSLKTLLQEEIDTAGEADERKTLNNLLTILEELGEDPDDSDSIDLSDILKEFPTTQAKLKKFIDDYLESEPEDVVPRLNEQTLQKLEQFKQKIMISYDDIFSFSSTDSSSSSSSSSSSTLSSSSTSDLRTDLLQTSTSTSWQRIKQQLESQTTNNPLSQFRSQHQTLRADFLEILAKITKSEQAGTPQPSPKKVITNFLGRLAICRTYEELKMFAENILGSQKEVWAPNLLPYSISPKILSDIVHNDIGMLASYLVSSSASSSSSSSSSSFSSSSGSSSASLSSLASLLAKSISIKAPTDDGPTSSSLSSLNSDRSLSYG